MKYKTHEKEGKFYVARGAKYWPKTAYETKDEAIQAGLCRELNEAYQVSQDAFKKLCELYPDKYSEDFSDRHSKSSYGDIVA